MSRPTFTKRVIGQVVNDTPPAPMNTFSAVGDINGSGLAAALYVVRTVLEDVTLREELAGYETYAQRVKHRLVPGVW